MICYHVHYDDNNNDTNNNLNNDTNHDNNIKHNRNNSQRYAYAVQFTFDQSKPFHYICLGTDNGLTDLQLASLDSELVEASLVAIMAIQAGLTLVIK